MTSKAATMILSSTAQTFIERDVSAAVIRSWRRMHLRVHTFRRNDGTRSHYCSGTDSSIVVGGR